MRLSAAIGRIQPSATLAIMARAAELRADGRDIISLSVGEPDFPPPQSACKAAIAAIERGEHAYTAVEGTRALREAVQAKFARENGLHYGLDELIVTTGGKQAIWNAFQATLNDGDEVLIPTPYWVSYPDMALLAGGTPVFVATTEADGYRLNPHVLAGAIGPRTRWFVLNSPSNPTGITYSAAELRAFADVLLVHPDVLILSDDMYEHIRYGSEPFATIAAVEPRLKARTLTLNGASKAFSMTGWRIGYAGGPRDLIRAMAKAQSQTTANPSVIAQEAAVGALTGDLGFLEERRADYQRRRDLVHGRITAIPGLSAPLPEGAFYLYVGCTGLIGRTTPAGAQLTTDEDVAAWLLENGVAVVHGAAFGASPAFRISYAVAPDQLAEACRRIEAAVASLR
jgi:aspartate aminotransferase